MQYIQNTRAVVCDKYCWREEVNFHCSVQQASFSYGFLRGLKQGGTTQRCSLII